MSAGLLIDITRCIGCGACSAACKEQNALPLAIESQTTAYTWTVVEDRGGTPVRRLCLHCIEPTCVSVCPVAALSKTADGPVVYDAQRCIGCRYCVMACPFDVPKYQWDTPVPIVGKCILCAERVAEGGMTACAAVCPTGATLFGEREALLSEAHARIDGQPDVYIDHVYGEREAGGTAVMMLAGVPFEQLGFKMDIPHHPLPMLTWNVLGKIPDFVVITGVFLFGLHWITQRRNDVQSALPSSQTGAETQSGRPNRSQTNPPSVAAAPARRRIWNRLFGGRGRA